MPVTDTYFLNTIAGGAPYNSQPLGAVARKELGHANRVRVVPIALLAGMSSGSRGPGSRYLVYRCTWGPSPRDRYPEELPDSSPKGRKWLEEVSSTRVGVVLAL